MSNDSSTIRFYANDEGGGGDDADVESVVEDAFDRIKRIRKTQRLRSRIIHDEAPSNGDSLEKLMEDFATQRGRYNLTPSQIAWFYPQSQNNPTFQMATHANSPNYWQEKEFLDLLVPTVIPDDSYFDEGELAYLNGGEFPLRFPIKNYIRQNWRVQPMLAGADSFGRYSDLCNRFTITSLNDRPLVPLVRELATNMSGLLRMSVDAYYSTKSSATVHNNETGEVEVQTKYSVIWPNTWGSVNETEILRSPEDLEALCEEIEPDAFASSLLKNTFHRRDVFAESNVRLHRILGHQIVLDQFPAGWLFK